jgi:hypothetical protein
MAGLARGTLIHGDTSGDPAALAVGAADEVLTHDGTDFDWAAAAGGGAALTGSTNNTVTTVTGADAISGEANLTFDGTDLAIASGNVNVASGYGIDFSATADGTTMSSELLDDYEEGTWNPIITDNQGNDAVGYSDQAGNYIKIGTLVFASGNVAPSDLGSVGRVHIGGLPFASKAAGEYTYYHGSPNFMNMKADVTDDAGMHMGNNVTYIEVYRNYNRTTPHHLMDTTTEVDTGTIFRFNMTYVSA